MNNKAYIQWLANQVFKMLPMSDETEDLEENHLRDFINSISIQIDGSFKTFPDLSNNVKYLTVANILHYWNEQELVIPIFKREIRNAVNLLHQIEERLGDEYE